MPNVCQLCANYVGIVCVLVIHVQDMHACGHRVCVGVGVVAGGCGGGGVGVGVGVGVGEGVHCATCDMCIMCRNRPP